MKKVAAYIRVGTYEQARTTKEAEQLRIAIEKAMDSGHARLAIALWENQHKK